MRGSPSAAKRHPVEGVVDSFRSGGVLSDGKAGDDEYCAHPGACPRAQHQAGQHQKDCHQCAGESLQGELPANHWNLVEQHGRNEREKHGDRRPAGIAQGPGEQGEAGYVQGIDGPLDGAKKLGVVQRVPERRQAVAEVSYIQRRYQRRHLGKRPACDCDQSHVEQSPWFIHPLAIALVPCPRAVGAQESGEDRAEKVPHAFVAKSMTDATRLGVNCCRSSMRKLNAVPAMVARNTGAASDLGPRHQSARNRPRGI